MIGLPDSPDRSPDRPADGRITSDSYACQSRVLGGGNGDGAAVPGAAAHGAGHAPWLMDLDWHHPLEDWLGRPAVRKLLGWLAASRPDGKTLIERIIASYGQADLGWWRGLLYWPAHKLIDRIRGAASVESVRKRVAEHASTVRGLVVTARSVAEFGLTRPQRFSAPLFCVWNFTNQCNLSCRHCYQDAQRRRGDDELTLAEKLDLVDQAGDAYMPMIALAGGEPTVSPDLLPVLHRCQRYGIHTSVATNGTTMTRRLAGQLVDAGVKYVEISLDSVSPAGHDAFRGASGMWDRTVEGMRNVVATAGLRLGVAICVHQGNFHEIEDMIRFAVNIGAGCLAHFNFIPVGRGRGMADGDLDPHQRESLLRRLNDWMQSGRIGVISTAPQLGRVCLAHAPLDGGRVATSHAGSSSGTRTRVVSKYLGGCGAGRTYLCIEPDGAVTPCVYMPQRILGRLRQRKLLDIFRHNELWDVLCRRDLRSGHCAVCRFRNYCGGCRARADAYFGQVAAPDPGCIFNDRHWDELLAGGIAGDATHAGTGSTRKKHGVGRADR